MVVYQIKNKLNGKIYIGSTVDKKRRWREHRNRLRQGRHNNSHLQKSWNKYGANNFKFSVLEKIKNRDKILEREQYYLDNKKPEYNISKKARAFAEGLHHTEETKQKISEKMKGENNPMYGGGHAKEVRRKMSESLKGKNNPMYGKEHTEETRQKISERRKGKTFSEEHKQKIGKASKGEKNVRAKLTKKKVKIIKYLLQGDSFTQTQIGKMFNVVHQTISRIKTGKAWEHVDVD